MARIHYVKKAQQRFETVPVLDENGKQKVTPVVRRDGTPKLTKKGHPITRRVTVSDRTKPLSNYTCGKCGKEIKVGDPYKWVKVKSTYGGSTYRRCTDCPNWKRSELSSSKMAGVYAAQEQAQESLYSLVEKDDFEELAQDVAQQIRDVAEEYRESQENMVEGFGHGTYVSDELGEKAEMLDDWADEIEQFYFVEPDLELDEDDEELEAHLDDQRDSLMDLIDNCPI